MSKWILGAQGYDQRLSHHRGNVDNSNYFWHQFDITNGRNIDPLGGDSDSESGDYDRWPFHLSEGIETGWRGYRVKITNILGGDSDNES